MLGIEVVVMSQRVVTVTEVLDGHVALDIQCPDRIYLNCYVPKLQTQRPGGGVSVRSPGLSDPVAGAVPKAR